VFGAIAVAAQHVSDSAHGHGATRERLSEVLGVVGQVSWRGDRDGFAGVSVVPGQKWPAAWLRAVGRSRPGGHQTGGERGHVADESEAERPRPGGGLRITSGGSEPRGMEGTGDGELGECIALRPRRQRRSGTLVEGGAEHPVPCTRRSRFVDHGRRELLPRWDRGTYQDRARTPR